MHCMQGPSVSIDTACSSSLVATHLACTGFLAPTCPRALVAGECSGPRLVQAAAQEHLS